ncbi:MAG: FAD binding domain-containing protein, partial [Halobacteriaceae archaeon]
MQQDLIKPLKHVDATSVSEAVNLMKKHGQDATMIAGNTDEINWLKNRMRAPKVLVDLKGIDALYGINERNDGSVRIGAMESVSNV